MRSLLFFLYSLCCTLHFSEVFAYPQLLSDERVPVRASPDIGVRGVRREIRSIPYYANSTNDYKATETLDTSWDAATLLEMYVTQPFAAYSTRLTVSN